MNFPDPEFSVWLLILLAVLAAGAVTWLTLQSRPALLLRHHWILAAMRAAAILLLLLALLNPFLRRSEPDPDAYRVAVLVDASASMLTRDLPSEQSRLEWVNNWLLSENDSASLRTLRQSVPHVDVSLFSDRLQTWDRLPIEHPMQGLTAIGTAIDSLRRMAATSERRLGAVLLLSDGINHSGIGPAEAVRQFARMEVPVSVIGVGHARAPGDVSLGFENPRMRMERGQQDAFSLVIRNTFDQPQSGTLEIYRNAMPLQSQPMTLAANSKETVRIEVDAMQPGLDTYRAVFVADNPDPNPATNTAFAVAEIVGDGTFRVLFLAAAGGWELRFLRLLAQESPTLSIDSITRVDDNRFLQQKQRQPDSTTTAARASRPQPLADRQTLDSLPDDPTFFLNYDAILIDLPMAAELDPGTAKILFDFVNTRGGGLLLLNSATAQQLVPRLAAPLHELFPARGFQRLPLIESAPLEIMVNPLFNDQIGGPLFTSPTPRLPAGALIAAPQSLSRAAQVPIRTTDPAVPLLVTHAFGAGRAAWLGSDALWRWQFGNDRDALRYQHLWEGLLSWLAVGGRDRMETPVHATLVALEDPVPLDIRLLGPDFTPRMDAHVTAFVTDPDGRVSSHRMQPALESPGLFQLALPLAVPGSYQVDYEAVFPEGDQISQRAFFTASADGPETRDVAFREQPLRDIARITGGTYRSFSNAADIVPLPLSAAIPVVQSTVSWTRSWPFLLVFIFIMIADWWLRRRMGLR